MSRDVKRQDLIHLISSFTARSKCGLVSHRRCSAVCPLSPLRTAAAATQWYFSLFSLSGNTRIGLLTSRTTVNTTRTHRPAIREWGEIKEYVLVTDIVFWRLLTESVLTLHNVTDGRYGNTSSFICSYNITADLYVSHENSHWPTEETSSSPIG